MLKNKRIIDENEAIKKYMESKEYLYNNKLLSTLEVKCMCAGYLLCLADNKLIYGIQFTHY